MRQRCETLIFTPVRSLKGTPVPDWVVAAIFATGFLLVAFSIKHVMTRFITFVFGAMLGFFALQGAMTTWWAWLIIALISALFIARIVAKRRKARREHDRERPTGGFHNHYYLNEEHNR